MPAEEQALDPGDPLSEHLVTRKYGARKGDDETPWRSVASAGLRERAEETHEERSQAARTADAQYNAPIADSYSQWAQAPNRYDIPGVDTIPASVRRRRAEGFLDLLQRKGAVQEFRETDDEEMENTRGEYLPKDRRLRLREDLEEDPAYPGSSRSFTLAHEGGHALDTAVGEAHDREEGFRFQEAGWSLVGTHNLKQIHDEDEDSHWEVDSELGESLRSLSIRARGHWHLEAEDEDDIAQRHDESYRGQTGEAWADAVAMSVLEPRAARREAPLAFDTIQREGMDRLRDLEDYDKRNEGSGHNAGDIGEFV